MGGQVHFSIGSLAATQPHIRSGTPAAVLERLNAAMQRIIKPE